MDETNGRKGSQEEHLQREFIPPTLSREDAILEEGQVVDVAPEWPRLPFSRLVPAGRLQHGQRRVLEEILFHREPGKEGLQLCPRPSSDFIELDPPTPHGRRRQRTDDSASSGEDPTAKRPRT